MLSWQRNGEPIVSNEKYELNPDQSELMIKNVHFNDAGTYVCTAFNRAGTAFEGMTMIVASK